jgi:hypothetical protein
MTSAFGAPKTDIPGPLDYAHSATLMTDIDFRGRIKVAMLKWTAYVLGEAPGTPAHSARLRYAQNCNLNPDNAAAVIQPQVVMDPNVQQQGSDVPDDTLQSAVEGVINRIL